MELDLHGAEWRDFVAASPEAGPFHHPAWAGLLGDCYRFRPAAVVVRGADGAVEAGVPVLEERLPLRPPRLLSLPFTDACAPLARSEGARRRLAAELACRGRLELRAPLEGAGLATRVRGVTHVLELDADVDAVARRFRSQMRRNLGRARRDGIVVRPGELRSDLVDVFYRLHLRTRRRQGVPVQPRRFFRLLWDDVLEPGLGVTLLAYAGGEPVAGAVFLSWNGTAVYKFGASDPAHWRLRPNNLLFWEAIRWACERGDRALDLGRTDLANAGLRAFKSGWGAVERPLLYTYAGAAPRRVEPGRATAAVGATIRHAPLWFCRAVGETAYRFAA